MALGHGGFTWTLPAGLGLGVGLAVGFGFGGAVTTGRGVGAGVAADLGVGVGAMAVGAAVGPAIGPLVGPAPGAVGVGRTATTTPLLGVGDCSGRLDGEALGEGGVDAEGVAGAVEVGVVEVGVVAVGPDGVGLEGSPDGADVTTGDEVEGTPATPLGAGRETPIPTVRAKVASTRLRTPSATTSRARWADVTSLVLSFPRAIVGRSVLSRTGLMVAPRRLAAL